jgi:lysozyme
MNVGPKGRKLIKSWETFIPYCYDDAKPKKHYKGGPVIGMLTIGYGHTAAAGDPIPEAGMVITKAEGENIFDRDVTAVAQQVSELVTVDLTQEQFDALVSFTFNVGRGAFARSTLLKRVNAKKFDQVPAEFMKWVNDNGKVLPGLVNRRRAEVALWREIKTNRVASAATPVDVPQPPKPITKSRIANTSVGVGIAGGLEAASQFNQAVSAASTTHDSVGILTALVRSPSFWIAIAIVVMAVAIWYWRYQMLKEEGA